MMAFVDRGPQWGVARLAEARPMVDLMTLVFPVVALAVAVVSGWCMAGVGMRRRKAEMAGYIEGWRSAARAAGRVQ